MLDYRTVKSPNAKIRQDVKTENMFREELKTQEVQNED